MKFTVKWLKEYIDFDLTPQVLADHLTMLGLEVDSIDDLGGGLEDIKVARILEVSPHPNADKLHCCKVEVEGESRDIVCGAPNAKAGMLTAIALPGITLPGGFKIKKAKIRGEVSQGMLCSEKDLGISDDHSGIMELPSATEVGSSLVKALDLSDTLIEVDLTPNRPDCTSIIGVAREVGAVVNKKIREPVVNTTLPILDGAGVPFAIEVEDVENCPRYAARLLENVTIEQSPPWLRNRLKAIGLRPINNVVDVTNYVMIEYGQPLHAFDYDTLDGGKIVVRRPRVGETITTLDSVKRDVNGDMLMICDGSKPVAVAGVMGGENSEVSERTTNVLLESACFNPVSIRRTSRQLNLSTDASYRFERGVDPELAPKALQRAVELICEVAGATVVDNGVDFKEGVTDPAPIPLRVEKVNDLLGIHLTVAEITEKLALIDIPSETDAAGDLVVTPPSFRVDLEREVDLVEEIARIVGYNEIPTSLPVVPMAFPEQDADRNLRSQVATFMVSQGFFEAINYSFIAESSFDKLQFAENDPARNVIRLLNPLSEDQGVMRTTLLPGLLENARHNINYQNTSLRIYEVGKVFHSTAEELADEEVRLTAIISGHRYPGSDRLHFPDSAIADIYDVKGVTEQLLGFLKLAAALTPSASYAASYAEESQSVCLKGGEQIVGSYGKLTSRVLREFGIKQDMFFVDISLTALLSLKAEPCNFTVLPKFLPVKWDLAVIVNEEVQGGEIIDAIKNSGESLVEGAEIFDIYRGKPIEAGQKSIAITISYRSHKKTLNDESVSRVHHKLIEMILSRFNGRLREI